jgi:ribose transport system substrate-binding protein
MSDVASAHHGRTFKSRLPMLGVIVLAVIAAAFVYATRAVDRTPKLRLALITNHQGPFWDPVIRGAQDAGPDNKVEVIAIKSEQDVERQSQHVRDMLAQGVDGIAISPIDPTAQAAVLNEAAGKTALITFDSDAPGSKRRLFVGTDNYAAGQSAGQEVREALPDGGAVIISARSVEMINGRDRRQGLIDDLLDRSFKPDRQPDPLDTVAQGSKYSVVATVLDNGDRELSVRLLTEALKAHPEAKCIIGLFTNNGPNAVKAVEQAGRTGEVKIIGFDESDETQEMVASGAIYSSILQDQYRCGYEAVRLLADTARGTDQKGPQGDRRTHLPINVLRKDNIADMRKTKRIHVPANAVAMPAAPAAVPTTGPEAPAAPGEGSKTGA